MSRIWTNISSMLLLAIFLFATTGVSVSKHICEITGHADIAFFAVEDYGGCCPVDKGCATDNDAKPGCCSSEQNYVKADIIKKHEEYGDLNLELPVLSNALLSFAATQTPTLQHIYTSYNALPPPSVSGPEKLIDIQVFRL